MATIAALLDTPDSGAIASGTLSIIRPGTDVRVVWIRPTGKSYIVLSSTIEDGDAVAGALLTDRFPINADEAWPLEVPLDKRIGIYSDSGTPTVHVHGIRGREV